jgi:hypothetical protein
MHAQMKGRSPTSPSSPTSWIAQTFGWERAAARASAKNRYLGNGHQRGGPSWEQIHDFVPPGSFAVDDERRVQSVRRGAGYAR